MSIVSNRWYFTKEQIENSPSRKCGIDAEKEIFYRQTCALLIRDIGHRLKVGLMVCDTAIVYMHRFYMRHSFTKFQRNMICMSAIFLSSKVEESPRKLEHVVKVGYLLIHKETLDVKADPQLYQSWVTDLVFHENLLLRTLGFDLIIEHPQKMIMTSLNQFKVPQDVIQATYYFASSMFITSTFCLRFTPSVMACICIYIFKNWAKFSVPNEWWMSIDKSVNRDLIKDLNNEYLNLFTACPENVKNICFKNVGKLFDFPRLFTNAGSSQSKSSDPNNLSALTPHHHQNRSDLRHSSSHRDSISQSHHKSSTSSHGLSIPSLTPTPLTLSQPGASMSSSSSVSRHSECKKAKLDLRDDIMMKKSMNMPSSANSAALSSSALQSTSASSSNLQSSQSQNLRAASGSQVTSSTGISLLDNNQKSSRDSGNIHSNTSSAVSTGLSSSSMSTSSALSTSGMMKNSQGLMDPSDILKMKKHESASSSVILSSQQQIQPQSQQPLHQHQQTHHQPPSRSSGISSSSNNFDRLFLVQLPKVLSKSEDGFKMEFSDNEDSNPIADNSLNIQDSLDLMMNDQFSEKPFSGLLGEQSQQPPPPPPPSQPPQIQTVRNEKLPTFKLAGRLNPNTSMHLGPDHHSPAAIIRNQKMGFDSSSGRLGGANSGNNDTFNSKGSSFATYNDILGYNPSTSNAQTHGNELISERKHKKNKKEKKKHKKEKKHKHKKKDKEKDREQSAYSVSSSGLKLTIKRESK